MGHRRHTDLGPAVIVEPVQVTRDGADVVRTVRLAWDGAAEEVWTRAPAELADTTDDASGFFCMALWCAMRRHEDLEVRGPVSPQLLARAPQIQAVYAAWDPTMRVGAVRAPATTGKIRRRRDRRSSTAFFSRGVDSTHAAARDRAGPRRHDALVFVDRLEPHHDEVVRAAEIGEAGAMAEQLGLPLVVMSTNVRPLADALARDWEDVLAAGLSFAAHALAGGARAALIPSTDSYVTHEPSGSSPLLDPLFSTERMAIEHDSIEHSRLGKLRWLTEHRPDLLEHLKVCARENRSDNCGVCGKCVHTMMCLHVTGGLSRAAQFPDELDLEVIAGLRPRQLRAMIDWAEVAAACDRAGDAALRDVILEVLRSSALEAPRLDDPDRAGWVDPRSIRQHRLNLTLSLMLEGEPYAPDEPVDR